MSIARFIPAPDQGDAQVVVLAVELFEGATVVILATTIWEELVAARFFEHDEPALVVDDDVGTEYRRRFQVSSSFADERRWSDSHGVHRINLEFRPPVPEEATYLRVTLGRWGSVVVML